MCTTLCSEDTLFTKFKTVSTVGITCSNKRWVDWCGRNKNHHPSPPLLDLNQNCFCGSKVFTWQFLLGQSGLNCNTKKMVSSIFYANTDVTGLKKLHGWLSRLIYSYYFPLTCNIHLLCAQSQALLWTEWEVSKMQLFSWSTHRVLWKSHPN